MLFFRKGERVGEVVGHEVETGKFDGMIEKMERVDIKV